MEALCRPRTMPELISPSGRDSLHLVPERGALVTHWRVAGRDILYFDAERFRDPSLSVRGGIPLLFPICGNLPGDRYDWEGGSYPLKQHGFARDRAWTVVEQAADRMTLALADDDASRVGYPFAFGLSYEVQLGEGHLDLRFRLENRDDRPLPFSLGIHPYFTVRDKFALRLNIPAERWQDQKSGAWESFDGRFDWDRPEIDAAFRELRRPEVTLIDAAAGHCLRLRFDPAFGTFVAWTLAGKDYLCLEPWTGPRNAIASGDGLLRLAPGETRELAIALAVDTLEDC